MAEPSPMAINGWKKPDELIRLQRQALKKRRSLAQNQSNSSPLNGQLISEAEKTSLLSSTPSEKRKNPFAKDNENTKKFKGFEEGEVTGENASTQPKDTKIVSALGQIDRDCRANVGGDDFNEPIKPTKLVLQPFDVKSFSKLFQQIDATHEENDIVEEQMYTEHLPMDWSLQTRLRFFCETELPSGKLKTHQSASSMTSFVRCPDDLQQEKNSGLDNSLATRFHRATYYWQYPYIPWMTLYPRKSRNNVGVVLGERERKALASDWDDSFRGLFHLLRSKQCAYFYVCANTFTVLFRASGIGGCDEVHALMSPTTTGIRKALRDDGINYRMPMKRNFAASINATLAANGSVSNDGSTLPLPSDGNHNNDVNGYDDDDDDEDWLANLEVDEREIRRMRTAHIRSMQSREMSDDQSDASLILIEGMECQGFFSFLLNSKSSISNVGRLAGVPPTLLAPVAFPKASMNQVDVRSSKVRMDNVDYFSLELKGTILPTILPYISSLFNETKDTYSLSVSSSANTLVFTKATQILLEYNAMKSKHDGTDEDEEEEDEDEEKEEAEKQNETSHDNRNNAIRNVESLRDCGLSKDAVESLCRTGSHAVALLERVCFDKNHGYAWR